MNEALYLLIHYVAHLYQLVDIVAERRCRDYHVMVILSFVLTASQTRYWKQPSQGIAVFEAGGSEDHHTVLYHH
jgi:hypothetical protein